MLSEPPAGYTVRYDLLRPLDRGLSAYAAAFDGRLPDRVDAAALAALAERIKAAKGETRASIYDANWGFAVPAGTPDDIVKILNEATNKALQSERVKRIMVDNAYFVSGGTPDALWAVFARQISEFGDVIRSGAVKFE